MQNSKKIISRGAEAVLYASRYDGQKVLVKERIPKNYRLKQIDEKIRKQRTRKEVRLLSEARKCGVMTPKVLNVDEASGKIMMEFVDGKRVKELLNSGKNSAANVKKIGAICRMIGEAAGKLHAAGIVHGDLTTSNMLLREGEMYFIDFGLGNFSRRIEDHGEDINLLHKAIESTHFKILKACWQNIVKGYRAKYKDADRALSKMQEIEKRARYVERTKQV
jgi:Kae1-associated kinase Bud32